MIKQSSLFDEPLPHFDGDTYDARQDHVRLGKQLAAVLGVVKDGAWHTLSEIASEVGCPEASVSARLRDLRKEKFGGYEIERRRDSYMSGLYWYRCEI